MRLISLYEYIMILICFVAQREVDDNVYEALTSIMCTNYALYDLHVISLYDLSGKFEMILCAIGNSTENISTCTTSSSPVRNTQSN